MLARFWRLIDSESVRLYQAVMYTCYFAAGTYMASFGHAPSTVQRAMGGSVHWVWIGLLIACPIIVLIGSHISDRYAGFWLQLGGNIGVAGALVAYVWSVFAAAWWGTGVFGVWGYIGLALCSTVIAIRDGRRIRQVGILARELDS